MEFYQRNWGIKSIFFRLQRRWISWKTVLWIIIAKFRPEATKKVIDDVRKNRSISNEENKEELVEVDQEIYNEIQKVFSQKGKIFY